MKCNKKLFFVSDMYQLEYNGESEKLTVKFSQIFPPWTLSLSDKEMRIVSFFLDEFSKIGKNDDYFQLIFD